MDGHISSLRRPSDSGRLPSLCLLLVVLMSILGICRLWHTEVRTAPITSPKRLSATEPLQNAAVSGRIAVESYKKADLDPIPSTPSASTAESIDLTATSWQRPFRPELWTAIGWTFDGSSMQSVASETAQATFRRAYRKLMLEFRIEPLAKPGLFVVRLVSSGTDAVTAVGIDAAHRRDGANQNDETVRERFCDLEWEPGRPAHFLLAATGNRISIGWNGHRLLNCPQPAEQSGQPFYWSFVSDRSAFRITDLRIEGE
jgi:hypothetical protein